MKQLCKTTKKVSLCQKDINAIHYTVTVLTLSVHLILLLNGLKLGLH